jgi:sarcosine oxidase subunit beta
MSGAGTADLVVVGAGTVGGWASWFAAAEGSAGKVVVLEQGLAGRGASSRASGVVRQQGGIPETVQLGLFSAEFYRGQTARLGTDSGFRELGYLLLAMTEQEQDEAVRRIEMQRAAGLQVGWVDADRARELNPTLAPDGFLGASYCPTEGHIDPPRNVEAYLQAMRTAGVDLRERTPFLGLRTDKAGRVTGVETPGGVIATERVLLTGGPTLRAVGNLVGARFFAGGARHQVVVTESHPEFQVERQAMVFDVAAGIYCRLEEGGLLWGMSNPKETPGEAHSIDWPYLREMQRRLAEIVPVTADLAIRKAWAATIDYTPDHLPLLGPVVTSEGEELAGVTVASAAGHGMMWGPGVAKCAADLALEGRTSVVDVSGMRMDRFDEQGRSPHHDPIALPFPVDTDDG